MLVKIDKILSSDNELEKLSNASKKQKQLSDIQEFQKLKTEEINNQIKPLRDQVSNYYAKVNDLNRELVGKMNERQHTLIQLVDMLLFKETEVTSTTSGLKMLVISMNKSQISTLKLVIR